MEIKETCKQQRTVDYVTQIAALLAEMPRTEWDDVLDYIYTIKWVESNCKLLKQPVTAQY